MNPGSSARRRLALAVAMLACGLCASGPSARAAAPPVDPRFDVFATRTGATTAAVDPGRPVSRAWLDVDAAAVRALRAAGRGRVWLPVGSGKGLDLHLEQVDVLAADAVVTVTDDQGPHAFVPDLTLFRGAVEGVPGSWVSLSCGPDGLLGVVEASGERWTVGPDRGRRRAEAGALHVVTNDRDLAATPHPFECGADLLADAAHEADRLTPGRGDAVASSSRLVCRVAIDCDYEFYSVKFGSNAAGATNYVMTMMAVISAIYERDLNVTLEVSYLNLWTTSSDPYTGATTSTQLPEFRSYWNANRSGVSRHIAHLLSGRDLGGGIAWVGMLCNQSYAYGVSAVDGSYAYPTSTVTWDVEVVAHEMGHNFNSQHTHSCYWQDHGLVPAGALIDSCYAPEGSCFTGVIGILPPGKGTIMSYCHLVAGVAAGIRLDFHPVCIGVMRTHAEGCLPVTSFPPPQPLVASAGVGTVALTWTASTAPGVIRNDVHRSVIPLDPAPSWFGSTAGTSLADDNVLGTYYYKVRALTATDTSDFSNEARAIVCVPGGPVTLACGNAALAPLVADFNSDGIADLAIANNLSVGTVSILLGGGMGGAGDGSFAAPVAYPCGTKPVALAAGDLDDDGITDLAVANNGTTGTWSLLRGQGAGGMGDGTFAAPVSFPAGSKASAVVVADFDEDGILDVAVAGYGSNLVSIYRGLGAGGVASGAFASRVDYPVGVRPTAMEAGDFNADGITDLAVVCSGSGGVAILLGQGSGGIGAGTFSTAVSYSAGTGAQALATGDFNHDGVTDLAVVRSVTQGLVAVLNGNGAGGAGNGTFAAAVQYAAGAAPNAIAAADLNGNGATDLVVTNAGGTASVLLGKLSGGVGNGAFEAPQAFDVGGTPEGVAVGDLDEDGSPDLVVAMTGAVQNLGVRRGTCAGLTAASVAVVSPNGGETWPVGSERTIAWTRGPAVAAVRVEVSRDDGLHWETIAGRHTGTSLVWTVTPPGTGPAWALVRVSDATVPGRSDVSDAAFTVASSTVGIPAPGARSLAIHGIYPNPSPGAMSVAFALPSAEPARLEVVDVAGRRVWVRAVGSLGPGRHAVRLAGDRPLPTGVYVVRLSQGARRVTAKAVVAR